MRHQHVAHGQHERQVGARVDGHPFVGEHAAVVAARVHQHDVRALLVGLLQRDHGAGADGVGVAAADEHGHLGVRHVGRVAARADGLRHAAFLGQVAGGAVRVHVRRPQRVHEALRVVLAAGTRILHHRERLGAVGVDDGAHLLGDLAVSLVPRDGLELALAVLLQRVGEAVLRVGDLRVAVAAGAELALGVGVVRIADELRQAAVDHVGRVAAFARAGVAQRVDGLGLAASRCVISMRLLPSVEAHIAGRCRERNRPSAASQEASPGYSVF